MECTRARYLDEDARRLQKLQVPNALHLLHADDAASVWTAPGTARSDPRRSQRPGVIGTRAVGLRATNDFECLVEPLMSAVGSALNFLDVSRHTSCSSRCVFCFTDGDIF